MHAEAVDLLAYNIGHADIMSLCVYACTHVIMHNKNNNNNKNKNKNNNNNNNPPS